MEERKKIMIVDDNVIDQMITTHVLRKNYTNGDILVMESAILALEYLEANKNNLIAMPSLILLDLDMPIMNGLGFLEKFKGFAEVVKNLCRIIVLTGSDISTDLEQMKANPHVVTLIAKPLGEHSMIPIF